MAGNHTEPADGSSASLPAFLSSIIVNSATALIVFLLFTMLKSRYPAFYSPLYKKRKADGLHKGSLPTDLYALVRFVLHLSKQEVIDHAGIDAYMFCRFMHFGAQLFSCLTYVGWRGCGRQVDSPCAVVVAAFVQGRCYRGTACCWLS